jgi:cell division protein ZapA (FtsZ GTPase activity inhibitor)
MTKTKAATITIDEKQYALADLTEAARAHIANIQFVDQQIQQLNNEWAVCDTARMAYTAAFKRGLVKA